MTVRRKAAWLSAIVFAFTLALLAPWHAASAGASPGGMEHRACCLLIADSAQPALAQAPQAAPAPTAPPADLPRPVPGALEPHAAERFCRAALPPPASRPVYLLTARLRR
jgi:hypothetical protein